MVKAFGGADLVENRAANLEVKEKKEDDLPRRHDMSTPNQKCKLTQFGIDDDTFDQTGEGIYKL